MSVFLTRNCSRFKGPNLHDATSVAKCKQLMSLSASPSTPKELWRPMQSVPTQKRIGSESRIRKRRQQGREREKVRERVHLCLKNFGPLRPNKCWSLLVPLVSCLVEWLYLPARRQKEISPDTVSHSCLQKEKRLNNHCWFCNNPFKMYTSNIYYNQNFLAYLAKWKGPICIRKQSFSVSLIWWTLSRCNLDTFQLWQDLGPRTCSQPCSFFSTETSNGKSGFRNHTHQLLSVLGSELCCLCSVLLCLWNFSVHS